MKRLFLLAHLNRLFPPTGSTITCPCPSDGAGSELCARLSTLLYAKLRGLTYLHTPMIDVTHVPENTDQKLWTDSWERFFNLGLGESLAEPSQRIILRKPHRVFLRKRTHYEANHCHRYVANFPEAYHNFRNDFRIRYHSSEKPELGLSSKEHNIAVHLRRGDVSANNNSSRYTPLKAVFPAIKKLLNEYPDSRIRIFSEGQPNDFAIFNALPRTTLHLNTDPFETFHHLVMADRLLMAKSSFSFLAALLSRGICHHEPFYYFYPRMPDWQDCLYVT